MMHTHKRLLWLAAALALAAGCTIQRIPQNEPASVVGLIRTGEAAYTSTWPANGTFTWAGPEFWPDRIDGWHTVDGKLICQGAHKRPMRSITLANPVLGDAGASFSVEVDVGHMAGGKQDYAGILLGIPSALPYPSATTGTVSRIIFAGITSGGHALVAANPSDERLVSFEKSQTNAVALPERTRLVLRGIAFRDRYTLVLTCRDAATGAEVARASLWDIPTALLQGHVALVTGSSRNGKPGPFWFESLQLSGDKIVTSDVADAGPILGAWYAFDGQALRMHMESFPISEEAAEAVTLAVKDEGEWSSVDAAPVDANGGATITVANWPYNHPVTYRLDMPISYTEGLTNATYSGTIAADPVAASPLTLGLADGSATADAALPDARIKMAAILSTKPDALVMHSGLEDCVSRQECYLWCLAFAAAGRTRPCIGAFSKRATCGGVAVSVTKTPAPERTPDELWQLWSGAETEVDISPETFMAIAEANRVTNTDEGGLFRSAAECPTTYATNGLGMVRYDRHRQTMEYHRIKQPAPGDKPRGELPGWPVIVPLRNPEYERPYGYLPPVQVAGLQDPLIQVIDQATGESVYLERISGHIALPRVYKDGIYTLRIGAPERDMRQELMDLAPASLGDTETTRITF